jgi:Uma2 family endonuclease
MIPDLAIEVVSPSNTAAQVLEKVREYLQAGVQFVWIVYPTAREIHGVDARNPAILTRLQVGDVLKAESLIPGFELRLATLFTEGEEQA